MAGPAEAGSYSTVYAPQHITVEAPLRMELSNQYYDLNIDGLEELCAARPSACSTPSVHNSFTELRERNALARTFGTFGVISLVGAGIATGAGLALAPSAVHHADSLARIGVPLAIGGGLGVIGVGLLVGRTFLLPTRKAVTRVVNDINTAQPSTPIHIGAMPTQGGAALMVSGLL